MLCAAILAVYSQTFGYGFVSFDDGTYVYRNQMIQPGLSIRGLAWACTAFYASNWHPLTWISYMLDTGMFGINAGEMHAVNVFLHLGSTILLFLTLERMTKQRWRSALVAGIFAVLIYGCATRALPLPTTFYAAFGAIFMFRIIIYLYDAAYSKEPVRLIDRIEVQSEFVAQRLLNFLELVLAQDSVVHENAGELVAHSAMHQRCGD